MNFESAPTVKDKAEVPYLRTIHVYDIPAQRENIKSYALEGFHDYYCTPSTQYKERELLAASAVKQAEGENYPLLLVKTVREGVVASVPNSLWTNDITTDDIYPKTMRTILFFTLAGALLLGSCANETTPNRPGEALPNVIIWWAMIRAIRISASWCGLLHTPNMDTLAASGILFTDGYVSDNHCRPSLQTLLNGMLPIDYYRAAGAQRDSSLAH